ncbi:MAG: putative solute:sodium symporter small subunit [Kiritimatiellia bacterium]|jgi:putative solute:sodium symporter small subunit
MSDPDYKGYWKENLKLLAICLTIWFICSFGFGILFVELFNKVNFLGYPLGFWFAQQGSIIVFLILIFFYAIKMNKLDRKYNLQED